MFVSWQDWPAVAAARPSRRRRRSIDHLPGDKLVGNFLLLHTYVLSWEVILDLTVSSYHAFIK